MIRSHFGMSRAREGSQIVYTTLSVSLSPPSLSVCLLCPLSITGKFVLVLPSSVYLTLLMYWLLY